MLNVSKARFSDIGRFTTFTHRLLCFLINIFLKGEYKNVEERKAGNYWAVCYTRGWHRFSWGTDRTSYLQNQEPHRAPQGQSQGPSQPQRFAEDGWSQKKPSRLPPEDRHRALPCNRWEAWSQKVIIVGVKSRAWICSSLLYSFFGLAYLARPKKSVK